MEIGDGVGQVFHQAAVQFFALRQPVEQGVLIEADHIDHPLDNLSTRPICIEAQGSIRFADDRRHATVNVRRGAPVDADFRLTGQAAVFQGRKIQIGKDDGAFQLEHPVPAQKHQGDMSLHTLHLLRAGAEGGRVGQQAYGIFLAFAGKAHWKTS